MTAWLGVVCRDHVRRGTTLGIAQLGHGKRDGLARLAAGDWLVYYSPRTSLRGGEPLQAFTAIGGLLGYLALPHVKPIYVSAVAAHVAGGFLFLIVGAAGAAQWKAHSGSRVSLVVCGSLSFVATAAFLLLLGNR